MSENPPTCPSCLAPMQPLPVLKGGPFRCHRCRLTCDVPPVLYMNPWDYRSFVADWESLTYELPQPEPKEDNRVCPECGGRDREEAGPGALFPNGYACGERTRVTCHECGWKGRGNELVERGSAEP